MSVMNGFREDFTERILGINSHISIYPVERELQNYKEAIRIIEENDVVDYANPIIENQTLYVITNDNKLYAMNTEDGQIKWIHYGNEKDSTIFGSANPVIYNNYIIG